ncbi:hypothetical protein JXB02_06340 [Candidatus Woesearchaeota archaeon]|nr:hypothetical protein [Candidatus Woesearchaeota archaeon]
MRYALLLAALLLIIPAAPAATLSGSVYDLSLDPVRDVIVRINTTPEQTVVAKDGTYSVEVGVGHYRIAAECAPGLTSRLYDEQDIDIVDDGDYLLDIILFPDLERIEEEFGLDELEVLEPGPISFTIPVGFAWASFIITLAVIGLFLVAMHLYLRRRQRASAPEPPRAGDARHQVLTIIQAAGGRTTQKEIRRQVPLSEAKISLVLAELEHDGLITKIRKGRGNIIVLKRIM